MARQQTSFALFATLLVAGIVCLQQTSLATSAPSISDALFSQQPQVDFMPQLQPQPQSQPQPQPQPQSQPTILQPQQQTQQQVQKPQIQQQASLQQRHLQLPPQFSQQTGFANVQPTTTRSSIIDSLSSALDAQASNKRISAVSTHQSLAQSASANSPTIASTSDEPQQNYADFQAASNAAKNANALEAGAVSSQIEQIYAANNAHDFPAALSAAKSSANSSMQPRSSQSYQLDYYPNGNSQPAASNAQSQSSHPARNADSFAKPNLVSHRDAYAHYMQSPYNSQSQRQTGILSPNPNELYDSDYTSAASTAPNTSEFERDLADLDEEFTRSTGFQNRPQLESMLTHEYPTRGRHSFGTSGAEFVGASDFRSAYVRGNGAGGNTNPASAAAAQSYADALDANWPEAGPTSGDILGPAASFYRWRPRSYSPATRTFAPISAASSFLASAAEQSPLSSYGGYLPTGAAGSSFPADAIGIALGPLAAAAAASALANVVDKSRQQTAPTTTWLAIPRITVSSSTQNASPSQTPASSSQAASYAPVQSQATSTNSANGLTAAASSYYVRPPTAFAPMPFYAYRAPNSHPGASPIAGSASAIAPSFIPYFTYASPHTAVGSPFATPTTPHFFAYRPGSLAAAAASPLLSTSASYQYPLAALPRAVPYGFAGPRAYAIRPLFGSPTGHMTDLHFDQTVSPPKKAHSASNSEESTSTKEKGSRGGITAMARNLSKKMFGSASQLRPQHVSPQSDSQPSNLDQIRDFSDPFMARMLQQSPKQQQAAMQVARSHQHLIDGHLYRQRLTNPSVEQFQQHLAAALASNLDSSPLDQVPSNIQPAASNSLKQTETAHKQRKSSSKHSPLQSAIKSLVAKASLSS